MTAKTSSKTARSRAREARLARALKANMARRKAQTRARAGPTQEPGGAAPDEKEPGA